MPSHQQWLTRRYFTVHGHWGILEWLVPRERVFFILCLNRLSLLTLAFCSVRNPFVSWADFVCRVILAPDLFRGNAV